MSRKPRPWSTLRRKKPQQEPRQRILIVCEGEKTEPIYFEFLRNQLRLSTAEVQVVGKECGSEATSVVEYAIREIRNSKDNPFDQVWCIIDVEAPPRRSLDDAYDRVISYKSPRGLKTKLQIILSNPCFEFWYILHFEKTSRCYIQNKDVISHLKQKLPRYEKSDQSIPDTIFDKTETAIRNSKQVLKEKHGDNPDIRCCNPSTCVHQAVEQLYKIVNKPIPPQKT